MLTKRVIKAKENIEEIIDWVDMYNRFPERNAEDEYEKEINVKLNRIINAVKGRGHGYKNHSFYTELTQNHPNEFVRNLFNVKNFSIKKKAEERIKKVIEWIVDNERYPQNNKLKKKELKIFNMLTAIRWGVERKYNCKFHPAFIELTKDHPNSLIRNMFNKDYK